MEHLDQADGHDRYVPSGRMDIMSAGHEGVYEWVSTNLVRPGMNVLDFGCGSGYGSEIIRRIGADVVGLDISPQAIHYATETYPNCQFLVADLADRLPEEVTDSRYDVIVSSEVIEHVEDPVAYLHNMADLLTSEGTCFVGTPNRAWTKARLGGRLLADSHVMEFTPQALVSLLRFRFERVDLKQRIFPDWSRLPPATPPQPGVSGKVKAIARMTAPRSYDWLATRRRQYNRKTHITVPEDIRWENCPDPVTAVSGVGLAAICREPKGWA